MESIKFDFNNMFDFSIGKEHGVEASDIESMSASIQEAHAHLTKITRDEKSRIKLGLEWARLPFQGKEVIKEVQNLGAEIAKRYENVLFLGIGGSYLGLKAAQDALCAPYFNEFAAVRQKKPKVYFEGNNLDPDTLGVLLKNLKPKKTFVVVISKSGQTTETKAAFMALEEWLKKGARGKYGRQILAITDPDSGSLRQKVNLEQKKDKLSYKALPLLKGVGGRFSEFNMGLLHLAILGIDVEKVLQGARQMAERCANPELSKNPAYMYAALHTILYRKKSKSIAVIMPFCESLKSTADWYIQLLAESLGKKYARRIEINPDGIENWASDKDRRINVGRTPVAFRGTTDLHSIQQNNIEGENNKVTTFIRVEKFRKEIKIPGKNSVLSGKRFSELIKLAQEATEWALVREARPSCAVIIPEITPFSWGGLLFFFEMATAFEGELLGVNAFDQPGVEGYKNYMYYKLNTPGIAKEIEEEIKNNPLVKEERFIL